MCGRSYRACTQVCPATHPLPETAPQPVPETAPNQCPRRRPTSARDGALPDTGLSGDPVEVLVEVPAGSARDGAPTSARDGDPVEVLVEVPAGGHGHGETSHELPTVLTDHRHRLRGRAEDRAGVACRVECECHVMSRETGPAVRILVQYLVRATLVSRL